MQDRLPLIVSSYRLLTGRDLVTSAGDLWTAPRAILAHGTQADPVFFYGNRLVLELFETDIETFTRMPSRLSAEPGLRDQRAKLMERVAQDGFIDDYSGVRISATGRRFRIEDATVWNLIDEGGRLHGQAATFDRWTRLD